MDHNQYPIVRFARSIGKNTAEFTAADMANYTKWWVSQPQNPEMMKAIQERQKKASQIGKQLQQEREGNKNMAKKHSTASFQAAQTSRLAERGIESPINDGQEEIVIHEEGSEVVCSMELTKMDVTALLWGLSRLMEDYELSSDDGYGASLLSLKEGLEGV